MIVLTGARGFIGSNLVEHLNNKGFKDLILVDEDSNQLKQNNIAKLKFSQFIERDSFLSWFEKNTKSIDFVFHIGARTDTTEQNIAIFDKLNLNYSKSIFTICTEANIPMLYASSAATYGDGHYSYDDEIDISKLKPLNPYAHSKQDFDLWVLAQDKTPPFWAGLKFFNVYGKHEGHKNRMASVVFHAYHQIKKNGEMKLFQSHKPTVKDGEQSRDFIYVNDLVEICYFFYQTQSTKGLYNVGTGKARSFNDLVRAVFKSLDLEPNIAYIPTPLDIRDAYQYFTEAKMTKLRRVGFTKEFTSLEDGVEDYVKNYLSQ